MSRKVRLRAAGRFDMASRLGVATIEIDRDAGVVSVRPLRRRRVYVTTLAAIAEWVVRRTILAELAEKRRARKAGRRKKET